MIAGLDMSHCVDLHLPHHRHNLLSQSVLLYQVRQETECAFFLFGRKSNENVVKRGVGGMAAFNSWK